MHRCFRGDLLRLFRLAMLAAVFAFRAFQRDRHPVGGSAKYGDHIEASGAPARIGRIATLTPSRFPHGREVYDSD